jgi:hypothetical protein
MRAAHGQASTRSSHHLDLHALHQALGLFKESRRRVDHLSGRRRGRRQRGAVAVGARPGAGARRPFERPQVADVDVDAAGGAQVVFLIAAEDGHASARGCLQVQRLHVLYVCVCVFVLLLVLEGGDALDV